MIKVYLVFLSALIFLFSCESKKNGNNEIKDKNEPFHEIKSFLGFKKGMSSKNVFDLLDSKSIKHSNLIPSVNLQNGEDFNSEQYRKKYIRYVEVYDYPIGNYKLDKFHLFFVNDVLYQFSFFRGFYNQTSNKNQKFDNGFLFKSKYGPIVKFIDETLIEKYGQPLSNGSEINKILDRIPDTPDLDANLMFRNNSKVNSSYSVVWRPKTNSDLRIWIDALQELEYTDSNKKKSYGCSFQILVEFSNAYIEKILNEIDREEERIKNEIELNDIKRERKSKEDI